MADVSPPIPRRVGAAGDSGQTIDLLLEDFSDEVLLAFQEQTLMIDSMHMTKRVSGGAYSWQFPVFGKTTAVYHQGNGESVLLDEDAAGNQYLREVKAGERKIYADNELIAPYLIPKLDQKLAHYDSRSIYAEMMARALRVRSEENKLRVLYGATQVAADSLFTGSPGGTTLADAAMDTTSEVLVAHLHEAKQIMDENEVPDDERYFIHPPSTGTLMFFNSNGTAANLEWVNHDFGGSGSIAQAKVPVIAGFRCVPSNHLPVEAGTYGDAYNIFDDSGSPVGNDYTLTVAANQQTVGIAFHKSAIGTVQVEEMEVESEYRMDRRAWLTQGVLCEGTGILRPESAILLRASA